MDIKELCQKISSVAEQDNWIPEEEYSVFNQWDKEYYRSQREEFTHKYRVFKAISSVLQPGSITELGTHGGSGADHLEDSEPNTNEHKAQKWVQVASENSRKHMLSGSLGTRIIQKK